MASRRARAAGGVLWAGLLLSLAGCASTGGGGAGEFDGAEILEAAGLSIPGAWAAGGRDGERGGGGELAGEWFGELGSDGEIRELVEQALERNPDLAATAARVGAARGRLREARGALLPELDGSASGSRTWRESGGGEGLPGLGGAGVRSGDRFRGALDLSWEIDLWGRLRAGRDIAELGVGSAEMDLAGARLSLAGGVIRAAIGIREAVEQLALAEEDSERLEAVLGALNSELERGLGDERLALSIALARADEARAGSALIARRRALEEARRQLELLMGSYPEGRADGLARLPRPAGKVPAGLPSELLLRRPDVLSAELSAKAAGLEVKIGRAALLPALRLTGSATGDSGQIERLLDPESLARSVAAGLVQPIFRGGRLMGRIDVAEAEREQAVAEYVGVVLSAFGEVEAALAAEGWLAEQERALEVAVAEAGTALELARQSYEGGLVEFNTLLDARGRSFDARAALVTVRAERARARVDLHLALGGGFGEGN